MSAFNDLSGLIADEEKGAVTLAIRQRLAAIKALPDGPVRARIFAASAMIGGAELFAALEGRVSTAKQLRRLADRIERPPRTAH
jgi:replicative superfamily II helicase